MRSAAIILTFVASAAAAAVGTDLPLPLGEVGWEGVIVPGEPAVEDIEAKIQKDHPGFSIYEDEENVDEETSDDPALLARGLLEARMKNRNCHTRYGQVPTEMVHRAISNLNKIKGNQCKAKARTCIRNQCVNGGVAVGMCNDNRHGITVACTHVARMADNIARNCWAMDTDCKAGQGCWGQTLRTSGQIFSDGGTWNVIVGQCSFFGKGERPV